MYPFCKNNYKKFFRQSQLPVIVILLLSSPVLLDGIARAAGVPLPSFNKNLAERPLPGDTVPANDTAPNQRTPIMDSLLRQRVKMDDTSTPRRLNDTIPADTSVAGFANDSMDLAKISADTLDAPIFFKVKDSSGTYVRFCRRKI
jgi:hypothetical protein